MKCYCIPILYYNSKYFKNWMLSTILSTHFAICVPDTYMRRRNFAKLPTKFVTRCQRLRALACYFKLQFWFLSKNRLPWAHKTLYPMPNAQARAIDCKNNDCSYVTAMTYTFDIRIAVRVLNMRLECIAMRFSTFSTISRGVLKCLAQSNNILYLYFMINSQWYRNSAATEMVISVTVMSTYIVSENTWGACHLRSANKYSSLK